MRFILLSLLLLSFPAFAQKQSVKVTEIAITDSWVVSPSDFNDLDASIRHLEAPFPSGGGEKAQLRLLKEEAAIRFPRKDEDINSALRSIRTSGDSLTVADSFAARFFLNNSIMQGGTPNDNTLAISNAGHLIVSWNTQLWGYDLKKDTFLFRASNPHPSLTNFVSNYSESGLNLSDSFDPKLYYDPHADRFVMMFLSGRDSVTSSSIIAFSSTNYPSDDWYAYKLTGNPLNDGTWTDYPQISFNDHSMFLTLNQLNGGDWVTDFDQTVIWQIDLQSAYNGASPLQTKVISDIQYEGKNLRYLRPVKTANGPQGEDMYFLSNRPRAIENDSFWLVHVTGDVNSTTQAAVTLVQSDVEYGLPPYAEQSNGHKFWTNDARLLGAVRVQDEIQFVGNTVNQTNGKAAIFHGRIEDLNSPSIKGNIIADPVIEFGFPNIEFVGTTKSRRDFVINFNHTSASHPAGNAAIFFSTDREYGPIQLLKKGSSYVDMLTGDINERWGDYIGLQRKYNELNKVWAAGYFGYGSKRAGTWISELSVPMDLDSLQLPDGQTVYIVNGDTFELIHGHYYPLGLTDVKSTTPKTRIFPNPSTEYVFFEFFSNTMQPVNVKVLNLEGRVVKDLMRTNVLAGKNQLRFNISGLTSGVYSVVITTADDNTLLKEKFIKE